MPDSLQAYRVHTLKDVGANAWRCAHNPPNPALLAAADRLGMVVMVENRRFGPSDNYDTDNAAPPVNATQIAKDVTAMVRTHRNSPSVILWSLCNEEGCFEQVPVESEGGSIGARMKQIILELDGTRAVMAAMNEGMAPTSAKYPAGAGAYLSQDTHFLSPSIFFAGH